MNSTTLKRVIEATGSLLLAFFFTLSIAGCETVDNERIPPYNVYIPFITQGDWNVYGVSGAADWRIFQKSSRLPAGYPWSVQSASGFGGVILCTDLATQPIAYDLACPVECKADVRIEVDTETYVARCPVCGSTYDIFGANHGAPLSGPAAERHYGLQVYQVGSNGSLFRLITR